MKKILAFVGVLALFLVVVPALAAAPDGAGPWADFVVDYSPGLRDNDTAIDPARDDPTARTASS